MKNVIENVKNRIKYGEIRQMENADDYRRFETEKEAYEWGEKNYKKWADWYNKIMSQGEEYYVIEPNFVNSVYNAVPYYCGYGYKDVNEFLRYKEPKYNIPSIVNWIGYSIVTAPRIPENIVVYRQISDDALDDLFKQYNDSGFFLEKGFMSTSLLLNSNTSFEKYCSNNVLKIYVPKGMKGMYVCDIKNCHRLEETEVLFMHGLHLQIVGYPYFDNKLKKRIVECKMIDFRGWD